MKNGQSAEPGYVAAVNLGPEATRTAHLGDADRDYIRESEREQRQWELDLGGRRPGRIGVRQWVGRPGPLVSAPATSKLGGNCSPRPTDGLRRAVTARRGREQEGDRRAAAASLGLYAGYVGRRQGSRACGSVGGGPAASLNRGNHTRIRWAV